MSRYTFSDWYLRYVCTVCGHSAAHFSVDICPVCGDLPRGCRTPLTVRSVYGFMGLRLKGWHIKGRPAPDHEYPPSTDADLLRATRWKAGMAV